MINQGRVRCNKENDARCDGKEGVGDSSKMRSIRGMRVPDESGKVPH